MKNPLPDPNVWTLAGLIAAATWLLSGGCASTVPTHPYRAVTDGCNCEEYWTYDASNSVGLLFRARYRMAQDGIVSEIDVRFTNNHRSDTLSLDRAHVKITSRNVSYQYNDRFLPLPPLTIPPKRSELVNLAGRDTEGRPNWNKIAGERMTVTITGVRIGNRTLPQRAVEFVPVNPRLGP